VKVTDEVEGKMVKLSAPGRVTEYWIFPDFPSDDTKVKIALKPDLCSSKMTGETQDPNKPYRLLLGSYKALLEEDYAGAKEQAKVFQSLYPGIAAPVILEGLAEMKEGNRDEATL
jgi:hypothetical protein